jgi:hypothetical protein
MVVVVVMEVVIGVVEVVEKEISISLEGVEMMTPLVEGLNYLLPLTDLQIDHLKRIEIELH